MVNKKPAASPPDSLARKTEQLVLLRLAAGGEPVKPFLAFVTACQEAREASRLQEVIDHFGVSPLALDCAKELFEARLRGLLRSCEMTGSLGSLCTEQPERLRAVIAALQSAHRQSG